jgi:hypothetical protein
LGPHDDRDPDLRNLELYFAECHRGDLIIMVSDGVHDNLDPYLLGDEPADLDDRPEQFARARVWDDLSQEDAELLKDVYRSRLLGRLLAPLLDAGDGSLDSVAPKAVVDAVIKYSRETTQTSRDFMEQHPTLELPDDYKRYPGKLDHVTCVCFRVTNAPEAFSQEE